MSAKAGVGSANRLAIFPLTSGAIGTAVFTFDKNDVETITGDTRTDIRIAVTSKIDNEALQTFLNTYLVSATINTITQIYMDNSEDKLVNVPSTAVKFGAMWVGATHESKRKVIAFEGVLTKSGEDHPKDGFGGLNFEIVGIPATTTNTWGSNFISAVYSNILTATTISINPSTYGTTMFMTSL